jgi:hypothetical protein
MTRTVVLDTGPLGLLMQRRGIAPADACRAWVASRIAQGTRFVVPEIADYEVRRELIRLGKADAVRRLDVFNATTPGRYLALTTEAMRVAADLWAKARQRGTPTADPKELDGDVILVAQVLTSGLPARDVVVATSNVGHIALFTTADVWTNL